MVQMMMAAPIACILFALFVWYTILMLQLLPCYDRYNLTLFKCAAFIPTVF